MSAKLTNKKKLRKSTQNFKGDTSRKEVTLKIPDSRYKYNIKKDSTIQC